VDIGGTLEAVADIDTILFDVVDGGILEIIELSLNYAEFERGVISVNGILIVKDSSFNNVQLESTSLILMTGGDILIDGCIFSDITLASGNGSVINCNMIIGDKVMIISMLTFFSFLIFFFLFRYDFLSLCYYEFSI
jgi:hypothetical protein